MKKDRAERVQTERVKVRLLMVALSNQDMFKSATYLAGNSKLLEVAMKFEWRCFCPRERETLLLAQSILARKAMDEVA